MSYVEDQWRQSNDPTAVFLREATAPRPTSINTGYTQQQLEQIRNEANTRQNWDPAAVEARIASYLPTGPAVSAGLSERLAQKKEGLGGYTPQERAAMEAQARQEVTGQGVSQRRALAAQLAQRGIRGGAAAAQAARQQAGQAQATAGALQNLGKQQFAEQQRRLGGYQDLAEQVAGLENQRAFQRLTGMLTGRALASGVESARERVGTLQQTLADLRARGF
jgi:hypothetical protein